MRSKDFTKTLRITAFVACLFCLAPLALGQTVTATGTTSLSATVSAEASLAVGDTPAFTPGSTSFGNFTGSTTLTYKIRTTKTGGSGSITALVTGDFGAGPSAPSVAGGALKFTCTSDLGTPCSGSPTASTSTATEVVHFDANTHGNDKHATVYWVLLNDPQYETGRYSATVTFTISAN